MFDFEQFKFIVRAYYFKLFRFYNKTDETLYFIKRWTEVVRSYSDLDDFISFDPPTPILNRLVSEPIAVTIVPHSYTRISRVPPRTSIFPYCQFVVKRKLNDSRCKSLEFLHLYLELTGIRIVSLFNIYYDEDKIIKELQEKYKNIQVYGNKVYNCFYRRIMHLNSASRSSKFRSHYSNLKDRALQSVGPESNP